MSSKAAQARFRALQDLGCICCLLECVGWMAPDIHHIVDKGYREHSGGDMATIPLCPWHHRGLTPEGMTTDAAVYRLGPSLALNKRLFVRTYGGERELLEQVNAQLNMRKTA